MKIGKYKITFEVDNQKANEEIDETNDKLKETKTDMDAVGETGDVLTSGLVTQFKAVVAGIKTAIKSLATLKGAILATGIGVFALAIGSVTAAFQNSEEGQNKFARLMSQIAVVTGNALDILSDFGTAILNIGKSLSFLVKGDLGNAALAFQEVRDNVGEAVEGIKNFGEETRKEIKVAGELADARAKADKIERQLLVDRADADRERAELLEKAVDREKFSTEERIKFLEDASKLDEEITKKEIALTQIRLDAKIEENKLSGSTKEDLAEEAQLRADLITLETTRLSKQKEVTGQIIALRTEEKTAKDNFRNAEREALAQSEDEKLELTITKEKERFDALIKQAEELKEPTENLEKAKLVAIQKIRDAANEEAAKKQKEADDKALAEKQAVAEAEKRIEQAKIDAAVQLSAVGIGLLAEGSNAAKALGIANAIISTYSGAAQVLDDPELPLFAKIAGVATVLATGFQQVRAIQQTEIPVLSVGGVTASAGAAPVPQIQPPSFNVVGASPINQLTEAIAGQQSQPVKAFVVAGDVTTAQELDRNAITTAGI
jgi:hypothetical protein